MFDIVLSFHVATSEHKRTTLARNGFARTTWESHRKFLKKIARPKVERRGEARIFSPRPSLPPPKRAPVAPARESASAHRRRRGKTLVQMLVYLFFEYFNHCYINRLAEYAMTARHQASEFSYGRLAWAAPTYVGQSLVTNTRPSVPPKFTGFSGPDAPHGSTLASHPPARRPLWRKSTHSAWRLSSLRDPQKRREPPLDFEHGVRVQPPKGLARA